MLLFDTDHVVISQQQTMPEYDNLIQRVRQHDPFHLFVSIISFHEQVMGPWAESRRLDDSVNHGLTE